MSSTAFVPITALPSRTFSSSIPVSSFVGRRNPLVVVPTRRASVNMNAPRDDGYVIKESEFRDPDSDDDSGDGFIGEPDMDDMLGVSMPEDLAGFEKREIANSQTREQLVDKLKDIYDRRKDILGEKRKGMGMDNVGNYLENL